MQLPNVILILIFIIIREKKTSRKNSQLFHIFIKSDGVVCGRLEKLEVYFYYLSGYVICRVTCL